MRKIVKYHIFSHFHRDGLENVVNSYLKDGWQPCGGVSTRYDRKRNICYYLQAMLEYEEEDGQNKENS
jgi:hypothetical protein